MKRFEIKPQHGIKVHSHTVWGVCEFVDGVFETADEEVIEKLEELGYEGVELDSDGTPPPPEPQPESEEKQLREKAKALGIKSYHVKKVETLIAEIEEIEKAEAAE